MPDGWYLTRKQEEAELRRQNPDVLEVYRWYSRTTGLWRDAVCRVRRSDGKGFDYQERRFFS